MYYPDLKAHLKKALQEQEMTYAELGQRIGLTESGVKKLFQAKDISLGRLHDICEALGLELSELIVQSHEEEYKTKEYDEETQRFFARNRECFDFYFLLLSEPKTFNELIAEHQIEKKKAYKFLRELESRKLIRWLPGDKVVSTMKPPFLFAFSGPFIRRLVKEWLTELVDEVTPLDGEPNAVALGSRLLHLREDSAKEFAKALSALVREFDQRSLREAAMYKKRVKAYRFFATIAEGSFVKRIGR